LQPVSEARHTAMTASQEHAGHDNGEKARARGATAGMEDLPWMPIPVVGNH
jgi:hypothetical protein